MVFTKNFIQRHWLTLALLVASVVGVNWLIHHNRAPGSMTVVEAQGMDMTGIRPPQGMQPVAVEEAKLRSLDGGQSFPATIAAFTDEDVVARVPGRVSQLLVYPGDKVKPGQLLGLIDAPEYDAELRKSRAMAGAKSSEVISAERMIEHHRNILQGANATISVAQAAKSRAQTDVDAAALELQRATDDLASKNAEKDERQAELKYADQQLDRNKELYKQGAISLNELQTGQRDRDAASARVRNTDAAIRGASQSVGIAQKRSQAAQQMVTGAVAQVAEAEAEAGQAREGIAQAHADASAKRFESGAATADTYGAATLADYRQLRSMGSGVVSDRLVSPGTAVSAGQVILKLRSVGEVRVQAEIPQGFASLMKVGLAVRVVGDGFERNGALTSVFPNVDPQTRTFRVEAVLQNGDGALKPGMFARLEVEGSSPERLAVKSSAIQSDDTGKFVWIAAHKQGSGKGDWTCTMHPQVSEEGPGDCPICGMKLVPREKGGSLVAHRQPIRAGEAGSTYTAIPSGLKAGDAVIWAGFETLIEGTSIQPMPWGPTGPVPEVAIAPTKGAHSKESDDSMPGMDMSGQK